MITTTSPEFVAFFDAISKIAEAKWILTIHDGAKWLKVGKTDKVTNERHELPFCFVEKETGDIYLGVNWRFPSKKVTRGNITDVNQGLGEIGEDGVMHRKAGCPLGYKYAPGQRKTPVRQKKMREEPGLDFSTPLISIPQSTGYSPVVVPGVQNPVLDPDLKKELSEETV